jgi:hypothetical protein
MRGWLLLLVVVATPVFATGLHALVIFEEADDALFLRRYESARYRVHVDYGTGTSINMRLWARGLDNPPRIRVLDERRNTIANRRAGSRRVLDFDLPALAEEGNIYYVEVTHRYPSDRGDIDVLIQLDAPASQDADGLIRFDGYFRDRDRVEPYRCAGGNGGGWPLAGVGLVAAAALYLRRRKVILGLAKS